MTDYEAEARQLMADGPGHGPDNCDGCGISHSSPTWHVRDLARRLEYAGDIITVESRVMEILDAADPYVADEVVASLYHSCRYEHSDDDDGLAP